MSDIQTVNVNLEFSLTLPLRIKKDRDGFTATCTTLDIATRARTAHKAQNSATDAIRAMLEQSYGSSGGKLNYSGNKMDFKV